jgi:2-keto-3-deoxy-L-rhamnonate aldolase RhmA
MKLNATSEFKSRLSAGENVFGTLLGPGNDPKKTVPALKEMGFDFLMLDLEHTLIDKETVYAYVPVAHEIGIPLLMRPEESMAHFRCYLDSGVNGLMSPHLDTIEEAVYAVNQSFFPPIGHRGAGLGKYILDGQSPADMPYLKMIEYVNDNTIVFSMTESLQNISNLAQILNLEGIVGTIVGTNDLAWDIGDIDPKAMAPDIIKTPAVEKSLKQIARICKEKGKAAGIGALQPKDMPRWADEGYHLFIIGRVGDGEIDTVKPVIAEARALLT